MPYDILGNGIDPETEKEERKRTRTVLIIGAMIFFFIMFILAEDIKSMRSSREANPTMDSLSMTYTKDSSDTISVYVVTDPDTGQQYLVSDHGGITPRLGYSPA